jgi:hypothetical protein
VNFAPELTSTPGGLLAWLEENGPDRDLIRASPNDLAKMVGGWGKRVTFHSQWEPWEAELTRGRWPSLSSKAREEILCLPVVSRTEVSSNQPGAGTGQKGSAITPHSKLRALSPHSHTIRGFRKERNGEEETLQRLNFLIQNKPYSTQREC